MSGAFEVIMQSEVKLLLDQFASVMKIHTVFYNADGHMLQVGRNENVCRYCQIIQQLPGGLEKCRSLDRRKQEECRCCKHLITYRCHAGLGEIMAPVTFSGEVIGFISFGQFRVTGQMPLLPLKSTAAEKEDLKAAFARLPEFSREEVKSLAGLCSILLDYIVTKELIRIEGNDLWERIKLYIKLNYTSAVSLSMLAEAMGKSLSTVSKTIRSRTGCSFKELLNHHRLELADKLLQSEKQMNIAEIALHCGFEDPYYFSRVYRKYRGIPPSAARQNQPGKK